MSELFNLFGASSPTNRAVTQVDPYASRGIGGGLLSPNYFEEDIVVNGTRPRLEGMSTGEIPIKPMGMGALIPQQDAPPVRQQRDFEADFGSQYEPPEKGKRGGRKLGFLERLGDAFLVQSGNKPVARERLRQENISDAMQGFTRDPVAAVERLNRLGEGVLAQEIYDKYVGHDFRNRQQSQKEREFDEEAPVRKAKVASDDSIAKQRYGNMAGRLISLADSQEKWDQVKPDVQQFLYNSGLDEMADHLPDTWSPEIYERFLTPDGLLRKDIAGQSSSDRRRGQDISAATSTANNKRSTSTSAANSARSAATSIRNTDARIAAAREGSKPNRPTLRRNAPATPAKKPSFSNW